MCQQNHKLYFFLFNSLLIILNQLCQEILIGLFRKITLVLYVLPSEMTLFPAVYNSSFLSMSETNSTLANSLWQPDKHLSVYALLFMLFPHSQRRLAK